MNDSITIVDKIILFDMRYFLCYVINFIRIFIILFVFLFLNKYDTGLLADGYRVNENSQVVALFLLFILTMLNVISLFMMKNIKDLMSYA